MFPLVELLFHECEQQTSCNSRDVSRLRFRLDEEIVNFGRRLEIDQIPLFINDNELDTLLIKAVQGIYLKKIQKSNFKKIYSVSTNLEPILSFANSSTRT